MAQVDGLLAQRFSARLTYPLMIGSPTICLSPNVPARESYLYSLGYCPICSAQRHYYSYEQVASLLSQYRDLAVGSTVRIGARLTSPDQMLASVNPKFPSNLIVLILPPLHNESGYCTTQKLAGSMFGAHPITIDEGVT